ncbi:alpha/beta hydrolase family protein [Pseudomonas sp. LRF_L74]|uniref:alpha/beta hydrolase family protein n=1 Tax=Pseudomonas sp. LRF_L74 TaxID=3369422 RepID=UPI003F6465D2
MVSIMPIRRFILLICCYLLPAAVEAAGNWAVGFHRLVLSDPLDDGQMHAVAFYPSLSAHGTTVVGLYEVGAEAEAPVAAGHFPLIVLSHGNAGSPLAQHDLATALARHGFIVLAVLHPGDNYQDQRRLGTLSNLYGRPLQLSAAIDALQRDALLAGSLDARRVGVIGYSAGGESALIMAGARPKASLLRAYCQERPNDADACANAGELVGDRADLSANADPRVAALLLLAPLGLMFDESRLHEVRVPVLLYSGDHDQVLAPERNAGALARNLPFAPDYRVLPGAGHFVFIAPCSTAMQEAVPPLCEDEEGIDRVAIHDQLGDEAVRFFRRALVGSLHASAQ